MHTGNKEFISDGRADSEKYLNSLLGKINFVLQIEPENKCFLQAKERTKNI